MVNAFANRGYIFLAWILSSNPCAVAAFTSCTFSVIRVYGLPGVVFGFNSITSPLFVYSALAPLLATLLKCILCDCLSGYMLLVMWLINILTVYSLTLLMAVVFRVHFWLASSDRGVLDCEKPSFVCIY